MLVFQPKIKIVISLICTRYLNYVSVHLEGVFLNKKSEFLWIQTVNLFLPTYTFIRFRQTSYRRVSGLSKDTNKPTLKTWLPAFLLLIKKHLVTMLNSSLPWNFELKDTTYTIKFAS